MADDKAETVKAFEDAVNMTPKQLEEWLETEESQSVGWSGGERKDSPDGGESVGHESGRRIVELLRTSKADLTDDDLAHMRKVTGYVHRHLAQRPTKEDVEHSRWRASLRNWGHDPLKG
ncbi:DUF3140 domain-containing protein [Motilibacter deserti]|uniref:DUF3140 domain-containing protein n=1 Tax=Motilibacter deserti TaxID=2714956 RepID=A0ABX0GSJ7_9ACTN|nr:DUF3140 domain-containing protein [Motilibacter deserti]